MTLLIDNWPYDGSLSETHTRSSEVTDFPVESGSDLTDNIRQLPAEVEIEGIVSNTPIGKMALLRGLDGGNDGTGSDGEKPANEALARLEGIWERRQPVTIQTDLKLYTNMAMTSLEIPRDPTTKNVLKFTASFKQIKIVTNQRSTVKAVPTATGRGGGVKTKPAIASNFPAPIVVFTLKPAARSSTIILELPDEDDDDGSPGRFVGYVDTPPWLRGPLPPSVLTTPAGEHFAARPGDYADGYIENRNVLRYVPFGAPILVPNGGLGDESDMQRLLKSYPSQSQSQTSGRAGPNSNWWGEMTGLSMPAGRGP